MSVFIDFFATKANVHYLPHRTIVERNFKFSTVELQDISKNVPTLGAADREADVD